MVTVGEEGLMASFVHLAKGLSLLLQKEKRGILALFDSCQQCNENVWLFVLLWWQMHARWQGRLECIPCLVSRRSGSGPGRTLPIAATSHCASWPYNQVLCFSLSSRKGKQVSGVADDQ